MSANFWHLILGLVAALVGTLSLGFGLYRWVSLLVIGFVNVYSMAVLLECAIRSDQTCPKPKPKWCFALPDRTWSLLQLLFLAAALVSAFANLYIKTSEIQHVVIDKSQPPAGGKTCKDDESLPVGYLNNKCDALYFSVVTITTLGYGDYAPASPQARRIVVWELVSGVLILLFVFPLLVSRISDF